MIYIYTSLQSSGLLLYFSVVPRINHLLRTVPPDLVLPLAHGHDNAIFTAFTNLFGIPDESCWDAELHDVTWDMTRSQAQLPIRLGGGGLRNSVRTSTSAYWASWADCLPGLVERFPTTGAEISLRLTLLDLQAPAEDYEGPDCLVEVANSAQSCTKTGWHDRPNWINLLAGERPPNKPDNYQVLGEWSHGWQFFASYAAEEAEFFNLLRALAWPSTRTNAAAAGKARMHSCRGPFSGVWLTVCPTSPALQFSNVDLLGAMRLRLGLAIAFEDDDAHGHVAMATSFGGGINARHTSLITAWRQVFTEAGALIPDRHVERLLSRTHVRVPAHDQRRMDLVVPGLQVERGLPLFCDVTVLSPIARTGCARPGTSNRGGRLLEMAEQDNDDNYRPVLDSGIAALKCLGCEVFGRWSSDCASLVPAMAIQRTKALHIRVRRGLALSLQRRWWGILGVALQKAVAHQIQQFRHGGADLLTASLEEPHFLADLDV